jgi:hypothetical protein
MGRYGIRVVRYGLCRVYDSTAKMYVCAPMNRVQANRELKWWKAQAKVGLLEQGHKRLCPISYPTGLGKYTPEVTAG